MPHYKNKNSNEIHFYESEKAKDTHLAFLKTPDGKKLGLDLDLEPISDSERSKIINPPKTQAQKINDIEILIVSILETEMKDTKYFFGYGFKYGRDSVARYPTDEEAIKLTAWQKAIWEQYSIWRGEIAAGTLQISTLTESYLNENLPNIDDF